MALEDWQACARAWLDRTLPERPEQTATWGRRWPTAGNRLHAHDARTTRSYTSRRGIPYRWARVSAGRGRRREFERASHCKEASRRDDALRSRDRPRVVDLYSVCRSMHDSQGAAGRATGISTERSWPRGGSGDRSTPCREQPHRWFVRLAVVHIGIGQAVRATRGGGIEKPTSPDAARELVGAAGARGRAGTRLLGAGMRTRRMR